jgi:DNA (cytosine-5)-methyltransferase 1
VFVVGYLGDWRRAAAVLFDRESLSGHPAPSRKAGQVAPTIPARSLGGGGLGTDFDCDGGLVCADIAPTLNSHFGNKQGLENQHIDGGCGLFVASVTNALTSHNGQRNEVSDMTNQLIARQLPIAIQERAVSENPDNGPQGSGIRQDGASYTLEARNKVQAVAFDLNQITSKTNRSQPDSAVHHTLPATNCPPHLATPWAVRRLTPVECERLMGFPDDFTRIPYRGKPADKCPDGPRYKALGNSWAVNCADWLGEIIAEVETWQ